MAFLRTKRSSRPDVKALVRRGDADAVVAAAGYQDQIPGRDGGTSDRGASIRREAIVALGALGPEAGTDAVHAALSDPADEVRRAAIHVLFARGDAVSLAAALGWLPAHHGRSRALAVRALLELRLPECAPALTAALLRAPGDHPVGDDEATLLRVLLEWDEGSDAASEVIARLAAALGDDDDGVVHRAAELLALIAPLGTEAVIAELRAGSAPRRAAAVLARVKDAVALEPLMDGLLHRDPDVRAECARALGELRDPAAVEVLIHATRDPEHRVRAQAGWALDRLGTVALMVGVRNARDPLVPDVVTGELAKPAREDVEDAQAPSDPTSTEALERLLAGVNDVDDRGQ